MVLFSASYCIPYCQISNKKNEGISIFYLYRFLSKRVETSRKSRNKQKVGNIQQMIVIRYNKQSTITHLQYIKYDYCPANSLSRQVKIGQIKEQA